MEEDDDPPPRKSLEDIMAGLEQSRADADAGRTVALETVLAELDASIAEMEMLQAGKVAGVD